MAGKILERAKVWFGRQNFRKNKGLVWQAEVREREKVWFGRQKLRKRKKVWFGRQLGVKFGP